MSQVDYHLSEWNTRTRLASPLECTGCGVCTNVCEYGALALQPDTNGYVQPCIEENLCVNCKKCEEVCPVLHHPKCEDSEFNCYAVWASNDLRWKSSSGGMFSVLAERVLSVGGVVCGAAMDEGFRIRHVGIEKASELEKLRGAKYVQSDMGSIYRQVREFLSRERRVLFAGCPCHVAGLENFIDIGQNNLVTVDLICHGVPALRMLHDYLKDNFDMTRISRINFRDKSNGWVCNLLTLEFTDGHKQTIPYEKNPFEQGYHANLIQRHSCFNCPFSGRIRQGDITLGDFWGIERHNRDWNDNKGTGLVLTNTPKGKKLFSEVSDVLQRCEEVSVELADCNRIRETLLPHPARERFFALRKKYSFSKAADYAINNRYDIGLIGCWSVENHGSNMTYYALYRALRNMGHEVLMIERPVDSLWKPNETPKGFSTNPYNDYDLAPIFATKIEMKALNKQCDTFILGSDQLLYHDLYNSFGEFIDMSYIHANKKKIAFSTSVGREMFEGTEDQRAKLELWLRQFDAVSVREDSGVALLRNTFGVESTWVLDPVFLCPTEMYSAMAESAEPFGNGPYMAAYMLDPNPRKEQALRFASKKTKLPLRILSDVAHTGKEIENAWTLETDITASNEKWLRAIRDCDFLITDSFHGVCFAILFQKRFICLANAYRGIARFTSLLGLLGLTDRMVYNPEDIEMLSDPFGPIDYQRVDEILHKQREASMEWLAAAIKEKKKKYLSFYDVLDDRIDLLNNQLLQIHERANNIEPWLANTHNRLDNLEPWLANTHTRLDNLEKRFTEVILDQQNQLNDLHNTIGWKLRRLLRKVKSKLKK